MEEREDEDIRAVMRHVTTEDIPDFLPRVNSYSIVISS
jgi:hypothetical protein